MRNITMLTIGAVMAFSAATASAAPAAMKPDSSCSERYGYYGYSAGYCTHDLYGRSSPADRYLTTDQPRHDGEAIARLEEQQQNSSSDQGSATRDREIFPDRGDRDRG
ncbi:MAG TPA: hypothetical protein VFW28_17195 [Micropepsaceae bacterium]|nr:hypothetical protein [Micropepsaceae bacterium]